MFSASGHHEFAVAVKEKAVEVPQAEPALVREFGGLEELQSLTSERR